MVSKKGFSESNPACILRSCEIDEIFSTIISKALTFQRISRIINVVAIHSERIVWAAIKLFTKDPIVCIKWWQSQQDINTWLKALFKP